MMNVHTPLFVAATACAGAFFAGCSDENEPAEHAANALHQSKAALSGAWSQFSDYSVDKKGQAIDFLQERADGVDLEIATLKDTLAHASDDAKERYSGSLETLESQREGLAIQMDTLQDASAEAWEDTKAETQQKWGAFVDFLDRTRAEL